MLDWQPVERPGKWSGLNRSFSTQTFDSGSVRCDTDSIQHHVYDLIQATMRFGQNSRHASRFTVPNFSLVSSGVHFVKL